MELEDKIDPELNWEHYKEIELEMLKTKLILCDRADAAVDLRNVFKAYYDFYPSFDELGNIVAEVKHCVEQMTEAVEKLTFEDMSAEEFKDPYEKLLNGFSECLDYDSLFYAYVRFGIIRPFGERLLNAHRLVQKDIEAAKAQEYDGE